jgi:hypothetical protein
MFELRKCQGHRGVLARHDHRVDEFDGIDGICVDVTWQHRSCHHHSGTRWCWFSVCHRDA